MAAKDAGLSVGDFITWSETAGNYGGAADCKAAWKSFKAGKVTEATLYAKALESGWTDPARDDDQARTTTKPKPQQKRQETRKTPGKGERPAFDFRAAWEAAEPATEAHPYIRRKLGLPFGLRVYRGPALQAGQALDGALLVPALNADGELQSWQAVPVEGMKLNARGAPMRGGRFIVGGPVRDGEPIFVAEGIAAAWSAHQATGSPAVCCFGIGNVETIARELRERYARARIVIVCDAGKERDGERIAQSVGGAWVEMPEGSPDNFDLNDYHVEVGSLETVAALLASPRRPKGPELPKLTKASDLLSQDFSPIRWLIPGLLPEGLMMLAARPKVGKSWLALELAIATATGGRVLDRPVARGAVLYLALEDSDRRMHARLTKLRAAGEGLGDLQYATDWPRGAEGAAAIHEWIKSEPTARLVVIDVFTKLRASAEGRETAYSVDYQDVAMLKPPPDRPVSILLVHHTRKAESDDPLDSISGTLGIGGAADGAWILKRARGADEAELHLIGRDLEEEGAFAVRFDRESCRWQWIGEAWKVRISAERRQALDALADQAMRPAELAQALGKSQGAARKLIHDMVQDGQIERGLDGRYRPVAPEGTA